MEEVRRRALLACDNKPEYARALREGPTWYRFGNDEIGYWKNAGYRYDFYEKPNKWKFRRKVTPFFSYERDPRCPMESDPLVLKAEPSIECRLVRFLVPTACISSSDERKG